MGRANNVLRNMLLAHGRAYRTIHRLQSNARAGLVHNMQVFLPANPSRRADHWATAFVNRVANRSVLEAVISGRLWPLAGLGQQVSYLIDTTDFIGVNHYTTSRVAFDVRRPGAFFTRQFFASDVGLSDITFNGQPYGEINPQSLYLALKELLPYKKPVYVTEHGLPDGDDDARPAFLAASLAEAWRGLQEGVDLRGYYHWTLMDNFEWASGWSLKFGLFEFDPETGLRRPKTSALVYKRIVRANGVPRTLLEEVAPEAVVRYFRSIKE
jgi:beta-glucosidase